MSLEAIVVLGFQLDKLGRISNILRNRLNIAIALHNGHPTSLLILSGGYTRPNVPSEAQAMRQYLLEYGISEDKIVKEEISTDTIGNIFFVKKTILEPKKLRNTAIVTSDFNLPRVKFICENLLGPLYSTQFFPAKTGLNPTIIFYRLLRLEKKFMDLTRTFFSDISGDVEKTEERIRKFHPDYSENVPKLLALTDTQLAEKLNVNPEVAHLYKKYATERIHKLKEIKQGSTK